MGAFESIGKNDQDPDYANMDLTEYIGGNPMKNVPPYVNNSSVIEWKRDESIGRKAAGQGGTLDEIVFETQAIPSTDIVAQNIKISFSGRCQKKDIYPTKTSKVFFALIDKNGKIVADSEFLAAELDYEVKRYTLELNMDNSTLSVWVRKAWAKKLDGLRIRISFKMSLDNNRYYTLVGKPHIVITKRPGGEQDLPDWATDSATTTSSATSTSAATTTAAATTSTAKAVLKKDTNTTAAASSTSWWTYVILILIVLLIVGLAGFRLTKGRWPLQSATKK